MKKRSLIAYCIGVICLMLALPASAGKPVDNDGDGYNTTSDCDDTNAAINPGAVEICGDVMDNNCDGVIDEGCGGSGGPNPHANLVWGDYPTQCMNCHDGGEAGNQYHEMFNSTHYQWVGETPDMTNQTGTLQGKLTNAVNSYCINIEGDWPVCGSCHAGRGQKPGTGDTKANVDCLMCHNEDYALNRARLPDGSMGPQVGTPQAVLDSYVQNIAPPTRTNCLKCHAFAGGGDSIKRGDLSSALYHNTDPNFDVHMNTTANLKCQDCHVFQSHKVIGKGSDLRPTDDTARGAQITCTNSTCHVGMDSGSGHASSGRRGEPDRHVARVACQACHIPVYGKVLDPAVHLGTEVHRDWTHHHNGTDASTCDSSNPCPGHPHVERLANALPVMKFWNRKSENTLLYDESALDPTTGSYPTSRPLGDVNDGKLTPFKYKTAWQPKTVASNQLIALNTFTYIKGTGSVIQAIEEGLTAMGYPANEPYEWVSTDTYQMINHGVNPASGVAACTNCHVNDLDVTSNSMLDNLGYALKGPKEQVCNQCHDGSKNLPRTHERMHNHTTKTTASSNGIGCYFCHDVKRPERNLCDPCDATCAAEYVDNVPYPHQCP